MDISIIEGIGLSKIEAKIFVVILELGESKAGKIIEKSGMQSSSVYNAINALISKGLVSYIKKSEVKYYRSADPEAILDYIDMKKREYLKILPELKSKQKEVNNDGVEFFKSYKGIKTIFSEMLKDAKKGDIFMTFSIENPKEYEKAREKVFFTIKQLEEDKGVINKGIFHENNRYPATKSSRMQKRYVGFPLPPNTLILNDMVAIISWEEEPKGILIHSKNMALKYREFFEHMWRIGRK